MTPPPLPSPPYHPLVGQFRASECPLCHKPLARPLVAPGTPASLWQPLTWVEELGALVHPACARAGKVKGWLFVTVGQEGEKESVA